VYPDPAKFGLGQACKSAELVGAVEDYAGCSDRSNNWGLGNGFPSEIADSVNSSKTSRAFWSAAS
jgi:hypothetical protein